MLKIWIKPHLIELKTVLTEGSKTGANPDGATTLS